MKRADDIHWTSLELDRLSEPCEFNGCEPIDDLPGWAHFLILVALGGVIWIIAAVTP